MVRELASSVATLSCMYGKGSVGSLQFCSAVLWEGWLG